MEMEWNAYRKKEKKTFNNTKATDAIVRKFIKPADTSFLSDNR